MNIGWYIKFKANRPSLSIVPKTFDPVRLIKRQCFVMADKVGAKLPLKKLRYFRPHQCFILISTALHCLFTKYVFMLIIILSNYLKCLVPLNKLTYKLISNRIIAENLSSHAVICKSKTGQKVEVDIPSSKTQSYN